MADHDQRLKSAVRECLADTVALARPAWADALDFTSVEWLETEVFPNPPEGERRAVDLVARVRLREPEGDVTHVLVHAEVESADSLTSLRHRMPRYSRFLGYRHGLPVLSFAVYLSVGLDGVGWDEARVAFRGDVLGTDRWPYLGLPALDAAGYATGDNLLGVALVGFMRSAEADRPTLKANALRRLAESGLSPYRLYLLMSLVEAYMPLDGPGLEQYRAILVTKEYQAVIKASETTFERGEAQGLSRGRIEEKRSTALRLLTRKFGPLSTDAQRQVLERSPEQLDELVDGLLDASSLSDLGLTDPA